MENARFAIMALCTVSLIGAAAYFHHDPTPEEIAAEREKQRVEAQRTLRPVVSADGCTVYRFSYGGRDHYFANCPGSVSSTYSERVGKTTTEHVEEITTNKRKGKQP